ncbi:peroxisome biogenesis factor 1 isoform X3 [Cynoglossus semilaevis]|uniref:peroxisome biogenesis factor 1 isoform X3 n=1 Tax=Cynoglossus semilaevis TaxID=244447 RepID=UPI000D627390|nr:peroxisome biogenesis factor 1 isoform X3 [Cynoglossus semilaevis]
MSLFNASSCHGNGVFTSPVEWRSIESHIVCFFFFLIKSEMSSMNRKIIHTLAESISKQVDHFSKTEVECLIREFNLLLGEPVSTGRTVSGLDKERFRSILHNNFGLTDDMIMDLVFRTFDKDNDSFVSVKEWIEGLSIFLRGTLEEKIKYCFQVYDLNGDHYISREEMFHMLKNSLIRQPTEEDPDEGIKDLVEITLKRMDHDHDGRLSFADFEKAVKDENLLLEAFGTCLPDIMNQALELSLGHGSPLYLSWTLKRSSSRCDGQEVELSRHLGGKLGLKDGEQCFLRTCHQMSSLHQVFVEPLSFDDWEILELHSLSLEQQLLNQIRVVFQDAICPVWVDDHTVIYIQIASLSPPVPYGHLEQFTELVVSPKSRAGVDNIGGLAARGSETQDFPRQTRTDLSSGKTLGNAAHVPQKLQRGGISDLSSFLHYIIKGGHDSVKELPPVPNIPDLLGDSVYRVCGTPPHSLCTMSHTVTDVVHVFPWRHELNSEVAGGPPPVTYGLLSKVPSPKQTRDKAKQVAEKKKNTEVAQSENSVNGGETTKEAEVMVVKVVCHWNDRFTGKQRPHSKVEICDGKVWIPQPLTARLNIIPHSMVRIKPVTSDIKVATTICLQPLTPQSEEDDEEIQTAFLGWLHTQSHEPLSCLTPRSGNLLLHGTDAKLEFTLTVLKPKPENDPPDQLFLLAHSLIRKEDVQVHRLSVPVSSVEVAETSKPEFPSLSILGGIDDLSTTGFEFISHSLLGSLLSQQLGTKGQGLGGGALLITGAKGSGKSALSQALCRKAAEDLDAHVDVMDCRTLQGKRAESVRQRLQDVFERAEWRQPSVVLLDDLDHLAGAPTSPEHEHGPEALLQQHVAQSLKDVVDEVAAHSSLVCLIITSHSEHSLHPSLTEVQGSHFIQGYVRIQPPDQVQRAEILQRLTLSRSALSEETLEILDLETVAKETVGYTPQDLVLLLKRAVHANTQQRGHTDQGVSLTWTDFEKALNGFTPPSLWGVDLHTPSGHGMERVGGLRDVRQQLMDTVLLPAKYPILFSKLPIRHRSGILLYGAPGTGKTLLARAVSKDSGMNFISIKGPELLSKYIGASEQGVRDVFQRAQAAQPCILFFDEFDSLAPRRGHDSTGVTDRVVNQLLTQLDGVEGLKGVYVLAATSRPDLVDPALLRPGRLDKSLFCPPPDRESRVEILRALSSDLLLAADVDLEQLAAVTEHFTGADLKALLYNTQLEAVHSSGGIGRARDLTSGSDSDMSLSCMIFPNNTSGSEDSAGEGEPQVCVDQAVVPLEQGDLRAKDQPCHDNVWRLYFGSSYESDVENSSVAGQNSQCVFGQNCLTQDCSAASVLEPFTPHPPAYMSSIHSGYEDLSPEQLERLQQDVNFIRNNYRRAKKEECSLTQLASGQPGLLLRQAHVNAALSVTRPSLSKSDWDRYTKLHLDNVLQRLSSQQL